MKNIIELKKEELDVLVFEVKKMSRFELVKNYRDISNERGAIINEMSEDDDYSREDRYLEFSKLFFALEEEMWERSKNVILSIDKMYEYLDKDRFDNYLKCKESVRSSEYVFSAVGDEYVLYAIEVEELEINENNEEFVNDINELLDMGF